MHKSVIRFLFLILITLLPSWANAESPQPYKLGTEDVLTVAVNNHPEFSGTFTVGSDGRIQYKTLGGIEVQGLTREEAESRIKQKVAEYVVSPEVSMNIAEYKSKPFYVLGEVAHPGKFYMQTETITVKEAVVMAGLPTMAAALRKAKIITPGLNGSDIKDVDLYALLYAGDLKENIPIHPGDSLFIPAEVKEISENKEKLMEQERERLKEKMGEKPANDYSLKYTLGPDDVVDISVMDHPDFSGIYTVSKDGKLQYKYFGDIDVTGMTRGQLEEKLRKLLSGFMTSPEVNVTITEFKSKVIYILGEVHRPGKYYMRSENISVKDALVMAGLPTTAAALHKVKVTTPGINGGSTQEMDLYDVLYGGDMKNNIMLSPGDSLYIPTAMSESAKSTKENQGEFDPLRYTLGPDDVVSIDVMNHLDFSGIYPVSLEGKIQYKYVGDIYVAGLTKAQLAEKIKKIISPSVSLPQVNVTIMEFKSKAFYVVGEVGAPGKFFMRSDNITVSEAVVMAGLPTATAAMRKTQIITPGIKDRKIRHVNLYALLYQGNLAENLTLNPGDYLYVPSTILAKVIRIISPVSSTIGLAAGPATDVGNGRAGVAAAVAK